MKSFKQFDEAYTDRFSHQSVENDNVGIFDIANPESLQKVNAYVDEHGIQDVMETYQENRQKYYEKLKHFKTFGRGWTRRVTETTQSAMKLI